MAMFLPSFVFAIDSDGDGLSDEREAELYTDPNSPDTDGDGFSDGIEMEHGYSPLAAGKVMVYENDYDGDGLSDWHELWFGSDIGNTDSDGDVFDDYTEAMHGYDPASKDPYKKFDTTIVVDRTAQRVYYYVSYLKMLNYPASTGNPDTPTPAGEYEIGRKIDNKVYIGADYYLPNVKWNMEFLPSYYIHTAYWHNDFGVRTHSHGCVNLREADAQELYQYAQPGTPVHVVGETPRAYRVGT